jgi:hypothetical protein
MYEKVEARKKKRDELYAKRLAEQSRIGAIRAILNTGKETTVCGGLGKVTRLRLDDEPQKVTVLVTQKGLHGRYYDSPAAEDERIFSVCDTQVANHKLLPASFARALTSGIKQIVAARPKKDPSWLIMATSMTLVSDPMFHEALDGVPGDVGAVSPFGYSGFLPDGSWSRNPRTFGSYSLYGNSPADLHRVYGEVNDGKVHPVGVLGGPFVAVRWDYLTELRDLDLNMFHRLGGLRGMIPQAVSAICTRCRIHMAQIPVESWMPAGYELVEGTPEANLAASTLRRYMGLTIDELNKIRLGVKY